MRRVPLVIMTSPVTEWVLPGFQIQLGQYGHTEDQDVYSWVRPLVYGYDETNVNLLDDYARDEFTSIGKFSDYPQNKWSDSFIRVLHDLLDNKGISAFWFMLDDYWITRGVDVDGIKKLYNFHRENHTSVIKIDLTFDRLYSNPGGFDFYANNEMSVGHLDLIKSLPSSHYHMSLWGGLFSAAPLLELVRPGWTAQEVELLGTPLLSKMPYTVYGTRQAPLMHTNICHGGRFFEFPGAKLKESDMDFLRSVKVTNGR